jgi:hypothetical protein
VPKIQWTDLPPALRDHLFDRLRDRKVTVEDLYQLKLWESLSPRLPTGRGSRTSDSSRSAAMESIRRLSCCGVRRREGRSSKNPLSLPRGERFRLRGRRLRGRSHGRRMTGPDPGLRSGLGPVYCCIVAPR